MAFKVNAQLNMGNHQISYQALATHLKRKLDSFYVLFGQDSYLLADAARLIKQAWRHQGETDEKILTVTKTHDWQQLFDEANCYSLFAELALLDVRLEKKTIENPDKALIKHYLSNPNTKSLILLQAPTINAKQLQWLATSDNVTLVQANPMTEHAVVRWIANQLQQQQLRCDPKIPALIQLYTQGNLLAAAQVIEKLSLIAETNQTLSLEEVQNQLVDQCQFSLYELADACLAGNKSQAIHLLRLASNTRTEPALLLWLITQEIRQLIQLHYLMQQALHFSEACSKLKIWSQRANLYHTAHKRLSLTQLTHMLHYAKQIDDWIKTSQTYFVWLGFERLALTLCNATNIEFIGL